MSRQIIVQFGYSVAHQKSIADGKTIIPRLLLEEALAVTVLGKHEY